MNILRIVAIALGILIPIIVNVGLEVVQPTPAYWRPTTKDVQEQEMLKQAYFKRSDIVFYLSVGIGITLIALGIMLVLLTAINFFGEGCLIGGVITMVIAFAKYWSRMNYWTMLIASIAAFLTLIIIGLVVNRTKKISLDSFKSEQKKDGA